MSVKGLKSTKLLLVCSGSAASIRVTDKPELFAGDTFSASALANTVPTIPPPIITTSTAAADSTVFIFLSPRGSNY